MGAISKSAFPANQRVLLPLKGALFYGTRPVSWSTVFVVWLVLLVCLCTFCSQGLYGHSRDAGTHIRFKWLGLLVSVHLRMTGSRVAIAE